MEKGASQERRVQYVGRRPNQSNRPHEWRGMSGERARGARGLDLRTLGYATLSRKTSGDKRMRNLTEDNLTEAVLAKYEDCKSERFQEIMRSLIKHLHAFVREVEL